MYRGRGRMRRGRTMDGGSSGGVVGGGLCVCVCVWGVLGAGAHWRRRRWRPVCVCVSASCHIQFKYVCAVGRSAWWTLRAYPLICCRLSYHSWRPVSLTLELVAVRPGACICTLLLRHLLRVTDRQTPQHYSIAPKSKRRITIRAFKATYARVRVLSV